MEETARVGLLRQEYEDPTFIDSENDDDDDDEGDSIPLQLKLNLRKVLSGTKTSNESSRPASNASSYLKFGDTRAVSGERPSTSFQESQKEWTTRQSEEETVDQLLNALIDEVEDVERLGRLRKEFEYPSFSDSEREDDTVYFRDQSVSRKQSKSTVRYYYRRLRYKP